VKVYGSTLGVYGREKYSLDRIKLILDIIGVEYELVDLYVDKHRVSEIEQFGGHKILPAVFINSYYVGGVEDVQLL
jgi:glutaredoxin